MLVTTTTKISDLIKANPASIDAIASINKHFKKLKNPILRRTLARRVTIADAARIGGVPVEVFFEKLAEVGFEIDKTVLPDKPADKQEEADVAIVSDGKVVELDVRPVIEGGSDPFNMIMEAIKDLPEGAVLKIINSFEPIPLITILREKGYESKVERPEEGVVHTYFKKGEAAKETDLSKTENFEPGDFDAKMQEYCERLKTIDVRHLEMPEPMVKILTELEVLPEGHALFVHHKKFPKFLLPELKSRGYQFVQKKIDDHNIDFLFFK